MYSIEVAFALQKGANISTKWNSAEILFCCKKNQLDRLPPNL